MTSINNKAFQYCKDLTSIVIPDNITDIKLNTFTCCYRLSSIKVSEGNKRYDSRNDCNAIIETETDTIVIGFFNTVIPNTITRIGDKAFKYSKGLTSIVIPDSVTEIGKNVFSECYRLTSIRVSSGNKNYDSRNDCNAIIETETNTLLTGCQNTIIPDSVTSIGYGAFAHCSGLTFIEIPDSVTTIRKSAFLFCSNLTSIVIPDSVTTIEINAFNGCNTLKTIYVPENKKDYFKKLLPYDLHEYIVEK